MASPRYRPLPGSARRYEDRKTGETLSHRQFRNVQARRAGWRSLSEAENDQSWAKWKRKVRIAGPKRDLTRGSKLASDYVKVKRRRELVPRVRRPGQFFPVDPELEPIEEDARMTPLGRLLIAAGLMADDHVWGVGDTP